MAERKRPPIVWVRWVDSQTQSGWTSNSDVDKEASCCETSGFLVKRDKHIVQVACSRTVDPNYKDWNQIMTIPRVAVVAFRKITK